MKRVAVFIDGFNLYHALLRMQDNKVKWLDMRALSQRLILPKSEQIISIYYFSAIAEWRTHAAQRHRIYISALKAIGVIPVMGQFKVKDRDCRACGVEWVGHEEKETDVNIALHMLDGAYRNEYDKALLISRDSDLVPAIKLVRERFPKIEITAVAPPMMGHSNDLIAKSNEKMKISPKQIYACLLPAKIYNADGTLAAIRPNEYN